MSNKHSGIITPNNGQERKVVGIDNKPLRAPEQVNDAIAADHKQRTRENISRALRELADKLDDGTLSPAEYILVVPTFANGETQLLFLGDSVPNMMIEGMLHRLLVKMAMA